jgi:hypothetical protein
LLTKRADTDLAVSRPRFCCRHEVMVGLLRATRQDLCVHACTHPGLLVELP